MSIGFTGTRHGCTPDQRRALSSVLQKFKAEGQTIFRHGCCLGADREAHVLWRDWLCGRSEYHPGDNAQAVWAFSQAKPDERVLPIKPYLVRNRDIIRSAMALVACPAEMTEQVRSGTWATVRYAREAGLPVVLVMPDGTTVL